MAQRDALWHLGVGRQAPAPAAAPQTQCWSDLHVRAREGEPFRPLVYRASRFGAPDIFLQEERAAPAAPAALHVRADGVAHFLVDEPLANYGHMLDVAQPMILRKSEYGERPQTYNTALLNRTWKVGVLRDYERPWCFVLEDAFSLRAKRYLAYGSGWFLADKTGACIFGATLPAPPAG